MASVTLSENEKYTFGRITGASVILGASDHVHAEQKFRKGLEITGSGTIGTEGSGLRLKGKARFGGPSDPAAVQIFTDSSNGLQINDSTGTSAQVLIALREFDSTGGLLEIKQGSITRIQLRSGGHSSLGSTTSNTLSVCTTTQGSVELNVNGDVAADNLGGLSDQRLKKNINNISGSLDSINNLRGVTYEWIDDYANNKTPRLGTKYGFIAQEVESVLPNLIGTKEAEGSDYHGYKNVNYPQVIPILVEAVKELTARIKVLEGNS